MLVRINDVTHFYTISEEYSCRLKREGKFNNVHLKYLIFSSLLHAVSSSDIEYTISNSSIDQLFTATDDILATPTIFQESYHLGTSTPNEIILTTTTSRKEETSSGYYIISETANGKSNSIFPSAEGTESTTGERSSKNGLSSTSNGGQTPTITSNPIAGGIITNHNVHRYYYTFNRKQDSHIHSDWRNDTNTRIQFNSTGTLLHEH